MKLKDVIKTTIESLGKERLLPADGLKKAKLNRLERRLGE